MDPAADWLIIWYMDALGGFKVAYLQFLSLSNFLFSLVEVRLDFSMVRNDINDLERVLNELQFSVISYARKTA